MFRVLDGSTVKQLTTVHNFILSLLFTGHLKGNKVEQKLCSGINHCMGACTVFNSRENTFSNARALITHDTSHIYIIITTLHYIWLLFHFYHSFVCAHYSISCLNNKQLVNHLCTICGNLGTTQYDWLIDCLVDWLHSEMLKEIFLD